MNAHTTLSMKQIAETLYCDKKHTDVDFILKKGSECTILSAHQIIISLSSKFWKEKFYPSGWKKKLKSNAPKMKIPPRLAFQIQDVSRPIFETILRYCYGKDLQLTRLNSPQLLKAADQFEMKILSNFCENFLIGQLESKELMNDFPFATKYLLTITQCIFEKITNNSNSNSNSNAFHTHNPKIVHVLLKNSIIDFVHEHEVKFWKQERLLCNIPEESALFLLAIPRTQIRETFVFYRIIERANCLNLQNPRSLKRTTKNTKDPNSTKKFGKWHKLIQKAIPLIRLDNIKIEENKPIFYRNFLNYLKSFRQKTNETQESSDLIIKKISENKGMENEKCGEKKSESREFDYNNNNTNDEINSSKNTKRKDRTTKKINKKIKIPKRKIPDPRHLRYNPNTLKTEDGKVLLMTTEFSKSRKKDIWKSLISGGFKRVNIFDASLYQLDYLLLKEFDAVFVYSISPWYNEVHVGDLLAKYLVNGGGVVICAPFCLKINDTNDDPVELKGRIAEPDVLPMEKGKLGNYKISKLEKILKKEHPIMKGVNNFSGGKYSYKIIPENLEKRFNSINDNAKVYVNNNINNNNNNNGNNGNVNIDDNESRNFYINTISDVYKKIHFKEYLPKPYSFKKNSEELEKIRIQKLKQETEKENNIFEEMKIDEITRKKSLKIGETHSYWDFLQRFSELFPNQIIFNNELNNKIIQFSKKWVDLFSYCRSQENTVFINNLTTFLERYQFYQQPDSENYLFTDNYETSLKRKKIIEESMEIEKGDENIKEGGAETEKENENEKEEENEMERGNERESEKKSMEIEKEKEMGKENEREDENTKENKGGIEKGKEGGEKREISRGDIEEEKEKEKERRRGRTVGIEMEGIGFSPRKRSLNRHDLSPKKNDNKRRRNIQQKLPNSPNKALNFSKNQIIEENSFSQNNNINTNDDVDENGYNCNAINIPINIPTEMFVGENIIIAEWDGGIPLIIEKKFHNKKLGKLIVLNFSPVSESTSHNNGFRWKRDSDGKKIIKNSVKYVLRYKSIN
ncbi:btb (poz) domain-containing 2a-related [Anaeramoeba flamelloides]|uniref:Btb (Poz) domain-containing 2a-related n=1 Tax=Anaeramoeba flamelloides TaxID=1746091 RepID=A0AAV7ZPW9_9EUKA|nr:btb (poz) domain-containing 2a-related [Anaeramoeba flamelloides]